MKVKKHHFQFYLFPSRETAKNLYRHLKPNKRGYSAITSLLVLMSTCFLSVDSIIAMPQTLENRELVLNGYQQEEMEQDLPAKEFVLNNAKMGTILGQRNLWQWDFSANQLKRISLPNGSRKPLRLRHMTEKSEDIFASSDQALYWITPEPFKVLEYKFPKQKASEEKSFGIKSLDSRIFWIRSQSIGELQLTTAEFLKWGEHPQLDEGDRVSFHPLARRLWIARGKKILYFDYPQPGTGSGQLKMAINLLFPALKIVATENGLLAHTKHTVLLLGQNGEVKKTIPVLQNRKLVLADYNETYHSYLYSDSIFEMKVISSHSSTFSKLSLGQVKKAEYLNSKYGVLAMILDGSPRVIQFEGQW